jgi:hypothetical protein
LLPGGALTPWLVESVVRLGACVPFEQVPSLLAHFTGVAVGVETARRLTEAAGTAQVARETAALTHLAQALPEPPAGSPVQQLSVDGAMVPLVGGIWAEVRTLALGTATAGADGAATTTDLSYFSRLTDAATFGDLATIETHRRGTTTAGTVVAVTDGATWCQGFVDLHRPDAVRVLDFPHAVEHLGTVAQAVFGAGSAPASEWLGLQAHALRHGAEETVLAELARLAEPTGLDEEVRAVCAQVRDYLTTRRAQIRYQAFAAAGYPLGSGCVESANKLVVEARLKGGGMHWARANVNPMLALRTPVANARWTEAWPAIWAELRTAVRDRAARRRPPHAPVAAPPPTSPVPPAPPVPRPPRPKTIVNGKPTSAHPWRRSSPFPFRAKP